MRDGTLKGVDVADGSVALADLADTARTAAGAGRPERSSRPVGAPGPRPARSPGRRRLTRGRARLTWGSRLTPGPPGPTGSPGPSGAPGVSGRVIRMESAAAVVANDFKELFVWCPSGKKILGGGYSYSSGSRVISITATEPVVAGGIYTDDGWHVAGRVANLNGNLTYDWTLSAWAVCAWTG